MTYIEKINSYASILNAFYNTLSETARNSLMIRNYSPLIDKLLIFLDDELLDEDDVITYIRANVDISDILDDYRNCVENDDIELPDGMYKKLLKLCSNTLLYDEIKQISFDTAVKFIAKDGMSFDDGFLRCKPDMLKLGVDFGLKFIDINKGSLTQLDNDSVLDYSDDSVMSAPVPVDYTAMLYIRNLQNKPFVDDFIKYLKQYGISVSDNLYREYEAYINTVQLTYSFRVYKSYRHLCGSDFNIIDYELNQEYSKDITLSDTYVECSADERCNAALKAFVRQFPLNNDDVVELLNNSIQVHYVYRMNEFTQIENFNIPAFDVNEIWDKIQNYSDKITNTSNSIDVPPELLDELSDEEVPIVENILKHQKIALSTQKCTDEKQKLSTILNIAKGVSESKKQEREELEAKKKERKQNKKFNEDD